MNIVLLYREEAGDTQLPIVPPNTRAPSPDRALSYSEAVPPERDRLPYAEPIPPEHAALAEPWIKVNGWFIYISLNTDTVYISMIKVNGWFI